MCLGIPVQLIEVENTNVGKVEIGGIRRRINLALLDNVKTGDYVLLHAGFAITKVDKEEAEETINLLNELAKKLEDEEKDV
jgi:hydrogenase expression/formation protein HypC